MLYLRPRYLAPLVTRNVAGLPASAHITSQWGTKGGTFAFAGRPPISLLLQICQRPPSGRGPARLDKLAIIAQCLSEHGYAWWTRYQPAGRFWPFQWIEGGWLLALSVLLIAVTIWLVRRRAT